MSAEIKLIGISFSMAFLGSALTFELLGIKPSQKTVLGSASISTAIFALISLVDYILS